MTKKVCETSLFSVGGVGAERVYIGSEAAERARVFRAILIVISLPLAYLNHRAAVRLMNLRQEDLPVQVEKIHKVLGRLAGKGLE